MSEYLIELKNISKRFGGVRALDGVSIGIRPGEIHCLAGENGSGKSTVIKVMSGIYTPEEGEILIDGTAVSRLDPIMAVQKGVQVIYQDFSLFGNLTVAENLALNTYLLEGRSRMDWPRAREMAREVLARLDVEIDIDAEVETLPTSGKQIVAIARALLARARLIVMDEPTTALTGHEVDALFGIVRDLQKQGIAVLFVSHKMREMLEISERLTVFRNGKKVAEGAMSEFDEPAITRAMTGLELDDEPYEPEIPADAAPALEVEGLTVSGSVDDVSLTLRPGEIVGISGLIGSGRTELARALFGMENASARRFRVAGKDVLPRSVQEAISLGIAYVPEDRLSEGLFLTQSIERNMVVSILDRLRRGLFLDRDAMRGKTEEMFAAMQIAAPSPETAVGNLSGGNAQRVMLGRWLLTGAKVLILNGPTVGVDVGSKAKIHHIIRDLAREEGVAVLMISDDVPELTGNCNRIHVMHEGRFVGAFSGAEMTEDAINDSLKALK
ncbi:MULTISPECIES: sugar ABC transporter ATP-binding protein [Nitratireductor]|uniref:sugar ABC transporter ATP-binding protein n=1 Tax=Nitratireductor TaxID=245876 RepID=UPI000DE08FFB|nr:MULTISPECIES: sugar ABC transporter ATP-binding protein [Nitratireductor]MBN7776262.1 sugar ABC transporter ATP-binding protein [Nitratireductor pacificus]MBN7779129.1 sugar ABC transporter ATP-binding protein [Nitratireductor pacificus]MBN7787936.1 sugar ABC transporter ATP-binding protein [Nitratireductor aquimarinus]MBY6097983.1 sugar ABC transporter ATP-binding protein [Nitratireductor aquimarinus]MCA1259829.1 sugar ABC transporter ATP-binding protein [Nitratireductor aquimarinus]